MAGAAALLPILQASEGGPVVVVAASTLTGQLAATSISRPLPAGVLTGDLLIAELNVADFSAGVTVTPPAGWTELSSRTQTFDGELAVLTYAKFYAGEAGPLTFAFSGSYDADVSVVALRNAGSSLAAVSVVRANNTTAGNAVTNPGATLTRPGAILAFVANDFGYTVNSGVTSPQYTQIFNDPGHGGFSKTGLSAGASGAWSATINVADAYWVSTTIAVLQPAQVLARVFANAVTISDVAVRAGATRARTAGDASSISDTTTRSIGRARTASDTVTLSDAAATPAAPTGSATDGWSVTDDASSLEAYQRAASDAWSATDAAASSPQAPRAATDAIGLTDSAATASASRARSAADSVAVSDSASSSSSYLAAATNLIANPSFEVSAFNWASTAGPGATVTTFARQTGWASSGIAALRVTGNTDTSGTSRRVGAAYDLIPLPTAGVPYTTWARLNVLDGAASGFRCTYLYFRDRAATVPSTIKATMTSPLIGPGATGVMDLCFTDVAPADALYMRMRIEGASSVNGEVIDFYLDAVSLQASAVATDAFGVSDTATRGAQSRARVTSDAVALSDAASRSSSAPARGALDAVGLSDGATASPAATRAASDAWTLSDLATRVPSRARAGSDAISLTDSAVGARAGPRATSDAFTLTDAAAGVATRTRSASDTFTLSDAGVGVRSTLLGATDAWALSELAARAPATRARSTSDAWALTDAAARASARARAATDTWAFSELAVRAANPTRPTTDAWTLTDAATRAGGAPRSVTDTLSLTDAATRAATSRARVVPDTVTLSDQATSGTPTLQRTAADAWSIAGTVTRAQAPQTRSAPDVLAFTGAAISTAQQARSASDTLTLADATTASATRARGATDAWGVSELAVRSAQRARDASDLLALGDTATRALTYARAATDAVTLIGAALAARGAIRGAADALSLSDQAARVAVSARIAADLVVLADVAARSAAQQARGGDDDWTTQDAATQNRARYLTALDALGALTDQAARQAAATRPSDDTLLIGDQALRSILDFERTAGDLIAIAEQAGASIERVLSATDAFTLTDLAVALRVMFNPDQFDSGHIIIRSASGGRVSGGPRGGQIVGSRPGHRA